MLVLTFTACLLANSSACRTVELQPVAIYDLGFGKQIERPMTMAQCQMGQAEFPIAQWLADNPGHQRIGGWTCDSRPKKEI